MEEIIINNDVSFCEDKYWKMNVFTEKFLSSLVSTSELKHTKTAPHDRLREYRVGMCAQIFGFKSNDFGRSFSTI